MSYKIIISLQQKINPEIFLEISKRKYNRSSIKISPTRITIQAKDKTALRASVSPLLRQLNLYYNLKS